MADAVAPTLGPLPGHVGIQSADKTAMPEILDDGAVIARRVIQLEDRSADMGAMFLRQLLWKIHENVGDGAATSAVLFRAMYNEALRYIVADGNAMLLRQELEKLIPVLLNHLDGMKRDVDSKSQLIQVASHICHDDDLASNLGSIFEIIGEYGVLEVQSSHTLNDSYDFIQGAYWKSKPLVKELIGTASQREIALTNSHILVSDLSITETEDIIHVLKAAIQAEAEYLLLIAFEISEQVATILKVNDQPDRIKVVAMQVPGKTTEDRYAVLQDIALLTGATPLLSITNDTIAQSSMPEHLGQARNAWASHQHFGIAGGSGDRAQLRIQIQQLKAQFAATDELETRQKLSQRLGVLLGGTAVMRVSGIHEIEIKRRKALVERTANALRGALRSGVVPGGGMAYYRLARCIQDTWRNSVDSTEQRAAVNILVKALQAPVQTLLSNTGYEPGHVLGQLQVNDEQKVFDVISGTFNEPAQSGMLDSLGTLNTVLRATIKSVALALAIDVLYQHENPAISDAP